VSKEESVKMEGVVVENLPNTTFRVKLPELDNTVIATLSGKMRQHNIRVLVGDRVEIEFSVYDLTRGRVIRRK
jgi:translation initiation factor IF-1